MGSARFGSTYTKIGTIQRRLAWPLCKDDTQIREAFHIKKKKKIDGETVETLSDFIFLGSKITADGDCSHEIKRHLLLGRKVMTNLNRILKSRDILSQQRSI